MPQQDPLVTVIILNYNGARWLKKCLGSIRDQTVFDNLEIIVADNGSADGSDRLAVNLLHGWSNGRVIRHGRNLGFCEGNNQAARQARGRFLFFLNNDTWMEPECLENLVGAVDEAGADAGEPLIIDYEDDTALCPVGEGFDMFGFLSLGKPGTSTREIFVVGGCSYLIKRQVFIRLGGFDSEFFMYVDEYDLSWRLWLAGGRALLVPSARLHHRGAANVNPRGGESKVEQRTSAAKRFYTNRNNLLMLLKNCQNLLLLMVPLQLVLLLCEAVVGLALLRRWSFVRRAYIDSAVSCWKLRGYVRSERKRIRSFRCRTDFQMLRFFRWRLNRWDELANLRRHGLPQVSEH